MDKKINKMFDFPIIPETPLNQWNMYPIYPYFPATRAKHAILGAMAGDALGATFEFLYREDVQPLIKKYSNFDNGLVGEGPFKIAPGQFTDDTEMALAIMKVVVDRGVYDKHEVARAYHIWYLSKPFDIGTTTRGAVSQKNLESMERAAKTTNASSISNGFLMRIYGLVALYYSKPLVSLIDAVRADVSLTHSHPETFIIAENYASMLYKAINGFDATRVYEYGVSLAFPQNESVFSPLLQAIYYAVDNGSDEFSYNGQKYTVNNIDGPSLGFVGFAFWLLLRSMKKHSSYRDAMLEIVSYAGDTDTNACIVGAVMGALYPATIPRTWIKSVTNFSAPHRFREYPICNPAIWLQWLPK